jgi:tetratricopeptide (TPR) repeat protein
MKTKQHCLKFLGCNKQLAISIFGISFFVFSFTLSFAQTKIADSLAALLAIEKIDSNKVNLMWQQASEITNNKTEEAILLSQQAVFLAKKINYIEGLSRSLGVLANAFTNLSNYPRALEHNLEKLKIEENRNKPRNLGSVLMNIGVVYVLEEEYQKAIIYFRKSDSVITTNNVEDLKHFAKVNLGDVYERLNILDSAYYYYNLSLQLAIAQKNNYYEGISRLGLGPYYRKISKFDSSAANYRKAIIYLQEANDDYLLCETTLGFAKLFQNFKLYDSAAVYANKSWVGAQNGMFMSNELNAAEFLKDHYRLYQKNVDSAFQYLNLVNSLNDSINSKTKIREIQTMSLTEQLRQLQLEEEKKIAAKERSQQLQMLIIAMFIPAFFLITLLLSRVRIPVRAIKILGILSLLILFEFLTLFLHPTVKELTHHTPILEMLVFVVIASILIPAHHRIEHWLVQKLVQNRNRVSYAKKINTVSNSVEENTTPENQA